jgi:hypothetical protein
MASVGDSFTLGGRIRSYNRVLVTEITIWVEECSEAWRVVILSSEWPAEAGTGLTIFIVIQDLTGDNFASLDSLLICTYTKSGGNKILNREQSRSRGQWNASHRRDTAPYSE